MKKLVPADRSISNKMPAANNTPKASRPRMAVTNQDHTVRGIRMRVIPSVRMSMVVVMKFKAPSKAATQKMAMLTIHKVWPVPNPGPAISPNALRGG